MVTCSCWKDQRSLQRSASLRLFNEILWCLLLISMSFCEIIQDDLSCNCSWEDVFNSFYIYLEFSNMIVFTCHTYLLQPMTGQERDQDNIYSARLFSLTVIKAYNQLMYRNMLQWCLFRNESLCETRPKSCKTTWKINRFPNEISYLT